MRLDWITSHYPGSGCVPGKRPNTIWRTLSEAFADDPDCILSILGDPGADRGAGTGAGGKLGRAENDGEGTARKGREGKHLFFPSPFLPSHSAVIFRSLQFSARPTICALASEAGLQSSESFHL